MKKFLRMVTPVPVSMKQYLEQVVSAKHHQLAPLPRKADLKHLMLTARITCSNDLDPWKRS